jgi:hypothetical protein
MRRLKRILLCPWRRLCLSEAREERRRKNLIRFERQFRERVEAIDKRRKGNQ